MQGRFEVSENVGEHLFRRNSETHPKSIPKVCFGPCPTHVFGILFGWFSNSAGTYCSQSFQITPISPGFLASRGANVLGLSCFHIWRVLVAPGLNTWLQNSRNFRIFPKSFWIFSGFFGAPQGPGMGPKCAPGGRLSNPEVSSESGQRRPDWWQKYILKKAQEPCILEPSVQTGG